MEWNSTKRWLKRIFSIFLLETQIKNDLQTLPARVVNVSGNRNAYYYQKVLGIIDEITKKTEGLQLKQFDEKFNLVFLENLLNRRSYYIFIFDNSEIDSTQMDHIILDFLYVASKESPIGNGENILVYHLNDKYSINRHINSICTFFGIKSFTDFDTFSKYLSTFFDRK
jgi:hypothetical protein